MSDDPTIARIRTVRHQISEQYHHDAAQLIAHYGELEQRYQHRMMARSSEENRKSRPSEERIMADVMREISKPQAGNF